MDRLKISFQAGLAFHKKVNIFLLKRALQFIQHVKLPLVTKYDTKKRIIFNVIPNTLSQIILQYFTATLWVSEVCPFQIDSECQNRHACQF